MPGKQLRGINIELDWTRQAFYLRTITKYSGFGGLPKYVLNNTSAVEMTDQAAAVNWLNDFLSPLRTKISDYSQFLSNKIA